MLIYFSFLQILPGVRVIIVNPETKGPLGDSHLGEVKLINYLTLFLKKYVLFSVKIKKNVEHRDTLFKLHS